ncbi:MAG: type I signal peptidase SipW [Parcubacteria group bacterium Gr01-1014_46]|nr:MAG: type I signal peptidase SipW [Parcubacteria group bacterium Gr01-1014_46]
MKFFLNLIYYTFVAGIVAIALLLLVTLVPTPGNFKIKVVKSGSMEPYIKTGGVVVLRPSSSYEVNDVVTFGKDTKDQIPTTHRIVKIDGTGPLRTFTTKGDANDAEDQTPIRLSDISGKVVFTLPYLGFVLDFAKKPMGFALLVGIPALVIIVDEIGKIVAEIRKLKNKKETDAEQIEQRNISIPRS